MQVLMLIVMIVSGAIWCGLIPGCNHASPDVLKISGAIKVLGVCGVISSIIWAISIITGTSIYKGD